MYEHNCSCSKQTFPFLDTPWRINNYSFIYRDFPVANAADPSQQALIDINRNISASVHPAADRTLTSIEESLVSPLSFTASPFSLICIIDISSFIRKLSLSPLPWPDTLALNTVLLSCKTFWAKSNSKILQWKSVPRHKRILGQSANFYSVDSTKVEEY